MTLNRWLPWKALRRYPGMPSRTPGRCVLVLKHPDERMKKVFRTANPWILAAAMREDGAVPTMRELGFDDPPFEAAVWIAFVVPAKTPPAVVERLTTALRTAAAMPDVQSKMTERGLEMLNTTPEQFARNYKLDFDVIVKRMQEFGIEAQWVFGREVARAPWPPAPPATASAGRTASSSSAPWRRCPRAARPTAGAARRVRPGSRPAARRRP
ncbi:hypothetical protein J2W25_001786 [Variovorax boronicumulans]|uniref:Uncharacterized protein n=1 Tax=Variovorax boronicumulans TaxID=436515 RepID=A0AAW8DT95_9BURK|nr:hypothetical protein [Variovorax boronicumulans]MDP9922765.1 hypothetical protein [Variovorax boronicumulans]